MRGENARPTITGEPGTESDVRFAIAYLLAASFAIGLSCHEKVSKMNGDKQVVSADRQIENLRKRITFPARLSRRGLRSFRGANKAKSSPPISS